MVVTKVKFSGLIIKQVLILFYPLISILGPYLIYNLENPAIPKAIFL